MPVIDTTEDELVLTVKFSRRQITEILEFLGRTLSNLDAPGARSHPPSPDQKFASQMCGDPPVS
jgi:hypothetical protein